MHWRNALSYLSQVIVLGLAMAFIVTYFWPKGWTM